MIAEGLCDAAFLQRWTNAPILLREDTGRLLRWGDVNGRGSEELVGWSGVAGAPMIAKLGDQSADVPADETRRATEMLWSARPVGYMAWSGVEQQSGATQIARALGLLYALTGSYDRPDGNMKFPGIPAANVEGDEFLSAEQQAKTLGRDLRLLGPALYDHIGSADIYRAMTEGEPYKVRGLVSFGSNLIMAHAVSETAAHAQEGLEFHVHADLFENPSARYADVLLPVASLLETEGLNVGFEISAEAAELVQLRPPLVAPVGAGLHHNDGGGVQLRPPLVAPVGEA